MGCNSSKAGGGVNHSFNAVAAPDDSDDNLVKVTVDSPGRAEANSSGYACPKCTYVNRPEFSTCEMCNYSLSSAKSLQPPLRGEERISSPSDGSEATTTDNNVGMSNNVVRTMDSAPSFSPTTPQLASDLANKSSPSKKTQNTPGADPVAIDAFDVHLEVDESIFGRQSFEGNEGFSNFDELDRSTESPKSHSDPFAKLDSTQVSNDIAKPGGPIDQKTEVVEDKIVAKAEGDDIANKTINNKKEDANEISTNRTKDLQEGEERIASAIAYAKNSLEAEQRRLENLKKDDKLMTDCTMEIQNGVTKTVTEEPNKIENEDMQIGGSLEGQDNEALVVAEDAPSETEEDLKLQQKEEEGQSAEGTEVIQMNENEITGNQDEETSLLSRRDSCESESGGAPLNVFRLTEQAWFNIQDDCRAYFSLDMSNGILSYYETDEKVKLLGTHRIGSLGELQKEDVFVGTNSYIIKIIFNASDDKEREELIMCTTDNSLRDYWYNAFYTLAHGKPASNREALPVDSNGKAASNSTDLIKDEVENVVENDEGDLNNSETPSPSKDSSPKKKKKNKKKGKN